MPTLDITDDHADRIEALREELAAAHAGPYASVDREDALAYLLDLADAVDDADRVAEPTRDGGGDETPDADPFDRDRARELLAARNRRRSDPDPEDPMDLSDIATAFDVAGRSEMTKDDLIDAILDAAERLAADPFARVDIGLDAAEPAGDGENSAEEDDAVEGDATGDDATEDDATEDDATGDDAVEGDATGDDATEDDATEDDATGDDAVEGDATGDDATEDDAADDSDDGGAGQLDAMMSLLDTHGDKWREADGDARYEVDLPDGSVETARTKDDVRALLFKNY
ncbi:Rho termination factor N-terminal domain-containing protein [Halorubrum sodomense]|uniref:Rho termination factor, N-terminal domain n=1 Tax=Halorubrum sodomense TaxID=35743 RepID=A0A1I6GWT8_HALSD|nr:Rho termination factor N-terminal domain-containing protein [Halorubrum sodomense]SFR46648.1 Rho termination factor, N-terminal domain [Halorubrum sodomense]